MNISKDALVAVLAQFNPWWRAEVISDLPQWRRSVFKDLFEWIHQPPAARAILLSGARQVGKTTLLLQSVAELLKKGVLKSNILYVTFDHPLLKLAGIDAVLEAWREREPQIGGVEYLFLDEAQFIRDWGTWVKHQVDFFKNRRIIFTGSAMPLLEANQESGVGRWHTIKLTTLSFSEYLRIKQVKLPELPKLHSLKELFTWPASEFYKTSELSAPYLGHFHEFLVRGGFPQTALVESITQAQRLLREDIIDKVLKRDMTALFGVRRILELEQTFLYLCMHDGGMLSLPDLCSNLEVKRPTAQHFIELLEASHLLYRLSPYGYGKDILRARYKVYLADAAISTAVMMKGKSILEDATALGTAAETAVFKHLVSYQAEKDIRLTYWRGQKEKEVDLVVEEENQITPFEVKYRSNHTNLIELKGLIEFCRSKSLEKAYVLTKSMQDFGILQSPLQNEAKTQIIRLPTALFCYWLGDNEVLI